MPHRVLIADDEPAMVALLTGWVETLDCDIRTAPDGKAAVAAAREFRPDVIVMDAMMPGMGGFDACLALQSEPDLRDIPVLFLTVRNEVQDLVNALDLGAVDYLTKPFKPQELLARLRSLMRTKARRDEVAERLEDLPAGLVEVDAEGRVAWSNAQAGLAAGQSVDEVAPGLPWREGRDFDGPLRVEGRAMRARGRARPGGGYLALLLPE